MESTDGDNKLESTPSSEEGRSIANGSVVKERDSAIDQNNVSAELSESDTTVIDNMISDTSDVNVVRYPGSINGVDFYIDNVSNSNIYLLDRTAQVTIDKCENCKIIIGPCDGSVFARNCENCTFYIASRQLRTREVTNSKIILFVETDPVIESSHHLLIAPWNVTYKKLDEQMEKYGFQFSNNKYKKVYDFSENDESIEKPHWELMKDNEANQYALNIEVPEEMSPTNDDTLVEMSLDSKSTCNDINLGEYEQNDASKDPTDIPQVLEMSTTSEENENPKELDNCDKILVLQKKLKKNLEERIKNSTFLKKKIKDDAEAFIREYKEVREKKSESRKKRLEEDEKRREELERDLGEGWKKVCTYLDLSSENSAQRMREVLIRLKH